MVKENMNPEVWGIFKKGDVVKNKEVWGNHKFEVVGFDGNWYCPILAVVSCDMFYPSGKPIRCNIGVKQATLINSVSRPFKNMNNNGLLILIKKKNLEAKRELRIRTNLKSKTWKQ